MKRDTGIGSAREEWPLVSVIVAAFNAEKSIEAACRSALAQTYPALEVIVVDDGSTDTTAQLVAALALEDARLHLIRQPNLGVAAARNRAIQAAQGEFLAPLDADDLWDARKLALQVQRFEESVPATALVYCGWVWIDEDDYILDRSPHWCIEGRILARLTEVNVTGSASVPLFRRSVVERLGGYRTDLRASGCQGCEDWDLALRVAEVHAVAVVAAVLVGYRRSAGGMSTQSATMWRSRAAVVAALAVRQPSIPVDSLVRSRHQFALHLAGMQFWSGNLFEACRWGMHARSARLLAPVLPRVAWMFIRMLAGKPAAAARLDTSRPFDGQAPTRAAIPYDRIYARRWRKTRIE